MGGGCLGEEGRGKMNICNHGGESARDHGYDASRFEGQEM